MQKVDQAVLSSQLNLTQPFWLSYWASLICQPMEGLNYFSFNIYTDFMVVMLLQADLTTFWKER